MSNLFKNPKQNLIESAKTGNDIARYAVGRNLYYGINEFGLNREFGLANLEKSACNNYQPAINLLVELSKKDENALKIYENVKTAIEESRPTMQIKL